MLINCTGCVCVCVSFSIYQCVNIILLFYLGHLVYSIPINLKARNARRKSKILKKTHRVRIRRETTTPWLKILHIRLMFVCQSLSLCVGVCGIVALKRIDRFQSGSFQLKASFLMMVLRYVWIITLQQCESISSFSKCCKAFLV